MVANKVNRNRFSISGKDCSLVDIENKKTKEFRFRIYFTFHKQVSRLSFAFSLSFISYFSFFVFYFCSCFILIRLKFKTSVLSVIENVKRI